MNESKHALAVPTIGKCTHHSIELIWTNISEKFDSALVGDDRPCFTLQVLNATEYKSVYFGHASSFTVENLEPSKKYCFRLRFSNLSNNRASPWSKGLVAYTSDLPMTTDNLLKAVNRGEYNNVVKSLDTTSAPQKRVYINSADPHGYTALMLAASKGLVQIVELLLERGAEVSIKNASGRDAMMIACCSGSLGVANLLFKSNASITTTDRGGSTPLHLAVDSNNLQLVEWLLRQEKIEIDAVDSIGNWTPLFRCVSLSGNVPIAKALIEAGANINCKDKDGKTCLMIAAIRSNFPMVSLLIEGGIDITIKTQFGKSAIDMAHDGADYRKIAKAIETRKKQLLEEKRNSSSITTS